MIATALIAATVPLPARVVEAWYSTAFYPRVERVLTPLSNAVPVACLDLLSLAVVAWLITLWWRAVRSGGGPRWPRVGRAALTTLSTAAVVFLAFLVLWGLNYRRLPLRERLVLDKPSPSTAVVEQLGHDVVRRLNGSHAAAHRLGWREPVWHNASLRDAFSRVQRELSDGPLAVPGRLKKTLYGAFFRWTGVDAMVNPLGLEVLTNPDLLPFERPFVAAHEWAHLAGYADESEANFVGWLTCLGGDLPAQYSGWLYLYWQVAAELPASARERVAGELRDGPRADLAAIAGRLRHGDLPLLRQASWIMYDSYLKANRVDAGVRSYGQVVTLILRVRFENGWSPVRSAAP